ncbi:Extracellular calcium-sensing receptor [Trichoplax sp. H2]|nr:Extracellular calcium-sensing receptor [Trichoplax sp. H2]|eukprot:RDD46093.1 Extracellular calcium-sensing receptor [Trichoplax sp. H2]
MAVKYDQVDYMQSIKIRVVLLIICLICITSSCPVNGLNNQKKYKILETNPLAIYHDGDYILGGLFFAHYSYNKSIGQCDEFAFRGLYKMMAMIYAVDQINRDKNLLPGVTLGYDIRDTCSNVKHTLQQSINFLPWSEKKFHLVDYHELTRHGCNQTLLEHLVADDSRGVIGVVGPDSSAITLPVANMLNIFDVAEISYAATSRLLVNKEEYPNLFRTLPSDYQQATVIADILSYFNWTYVATISVDDFYGRLAIDLMKRRFDANSICIALEETIPATPSPAKISLVVQKMLELDNVSVIILIASESAAFSVLHEAQRQKLYYKTWIGTDAWGTSPVVLGLQPEVIGGVLGIAPESSQLAGQLPPSFQNILQAIDKDQITTMIDELLNCSHGYQDCYLSREPSSSSLSSTPFLKVPSSAASNIEISNTPDNPTQCNNIKQYASDKGNKVAFIIDSVYILATALHKLLNCTSQSCQKEDVIDRKVLLSILSNLNIRGYHNHTLKFNAQREINRVYIIDNVHFSSTNGSCGHYKNVGNWFNGTLVIHNNLLRWVNGTSLSIPTSRCSISCLPGYKKIKPDKNSCCWICLECGPGLISDGQSSTCNECELGQKAAPDHTFCINLTIITISMSHPASIALTITSLLVAAINSLVVGIYIKYQHTPIVKASNSFLSFFHLTSIYFMLGISILLLAKPTTMICTLSLSLLPISLILCIAVLITRTHHIASIFHLNFAYLLDTTTPIARAKRVVRQVAFITLLTLVGVIMIIVVNIITPIGPIRDYRVTNSVYVICDSSNAINLALPAGYFIFLCLLCNVFAWKTRNLPGNFNEAKHICFCSITVLIILALALPTYIRTYGILRTIIASISLQCYSLAVLVFLFLPKVYTMTITPHLNTKRRCLQSIQTFSFSNSPFGNSTHNGLESTIISRSNSSHNKKTINNAGHSTVYTNGSINCSNKTGSINHHGNNTSTNIINKAGSINQGNNPSNDAIDKSGSINHGSNTSTNITNETGSINQDNNVGNNAINETGSINRSGSNSSNNSINQGDNTGNITINKTGSINHGNNSSNNTINKTGSINQGEYSNGNNPNKDNDSDSNNDNSSNTSGKNTKSNNN